MPAILSSHIASTDETLVYFVLPNGEVRLAPDNRIRNPHLLGWAGAHCFEAKTAKEKDDVSRRMAKQLFEKKRTMEVEKHMREQAKRNELRASAKIRLANPRSKFDALCNQKIIEKIEQDEQAFFKLLSEEFDPAKRTSGLEMEWQEAPIGMAARGEKRAGLAS